MGFLDVTLCPNEECQTTTVDKKIINCPVCNTTIIKLGIGSKEYQAIIDAKKKKEPEKAILISDDMTDEAIKGQIQQDMRNLKSHEAGSGWMRASTLLSGNSTDRVLMEGFKSLIDQNKIMIRQNELILRALTKKE